MPEIGQIEKGVGIPGPQAITSAPIPQVAQPVIRPPGTGGGIRLGEGKMAFALITKANKGKFKVQKIAIDSESRLVQQTMERMKEKESLERVEKLQLQEKQAKIAAAQQLSEESDSDEEMGSDAEGQDQELN
uniref:Uncharacterized protein n=1 Tax=Favella ehrenbergii TaxID=182087 RepID=A0A7S3ML44_9SPIT|mmetsp:Transcript_26301/g.35111  ORF Transcript_26301/g.35111 Transcript_26301/m.35111 type:complete len:132 (+) Transcript_26301:288-683(+)|eukprot:CAMPEP_0170476746 /NCGR_PEP_ID=MMETSP0123-20130129/18103_1 /TAXON_ID=182087 /ORGANISM="Favella ehrenbergii, Strain Fehren 1" /LENGTH=131 /DNA_ID=CAMNT_0010747977 /DNA_START=204 /DNA_END=599 /DNA_ORIENTATION=-